MEATIKPKILIVDDKRSNLFMLGALLSKIEAEVHEASSGKEALAQAQDHDFALFLLDVQMPEMDGYQLADKYLASDKTHNIPIIFITASEQNEVAVDSAYEHGAIDYITKPINENKLISKVLIFLKIWKKGNELGMALELVAEKNLKLNAANKSLEEEIKQRQKIQEELDRLAMFDSLTGLPNRLMIKKESCRVIAASKRYHQNTGFMFLDLDGFKAVNDNNGHDAGDAVLIEVSLKIQSVIRDIDTLGRLGGDEFIIVLPNCATRKDIGVIAERVISVVNTPIESVMIKEKLGISIGISLYPDDAYDAESLINHADKAMYVAKNAGKNQYKLYERDTH